MRCGRIRLLAQALAAIGLVIRPVALEPAHLALALERQDMGCHSV
jgi:hypothetical protein